MANAPAAQYISRFGDQSIAGSQYALKKLGVDRSDCFLKIEKYMILCVPFQLGFKRSIFMASLSKQEMLFFQRYVNNIVGLSIALNPDNRPKPLKFFIHGTLSTLGKMKDRENAGLFVIDYKVSPDEMTLMLGHFMELEERIKSQYDDYGKTPIKITPEAAQAMGYNMYATVSDGKGEPRRILVLSLNSKFLEYAESADAPALLPGTSVTYQLFFKKYRISIMGRINATGPLPMQKVKRSVANIEFNPELVEIIDDYWYKSSPKKMKK
jgi:hypothetical protein